MSRYVLKEFIEAVATVLTACGIETFRDCQLLRVSMIVATVLTACGIETPLFFWLSLQPTHVLQQCLPLAVLKPVSPP